VRDLNPANDCRSTNVNQSLPYALGYSESEFKRLESQAAFFRDLTEDLLRRSGVVSGMRVLDVGRGVGEVSLLAAELVGPSGAVLGVDRSKDAVGVAHQRAVAAEQRWVRFYSTELDAFAAEEEFDAIIGRLILMYLPNPAETLRRLCRHLRPDGIVVFQEMVMPLFATFLSAGLHPPQMIAAGRFEGGPHSPVYDWLAGVLRSLLPIAERLGVVTAAEVEIETMAERLRNEAVQQNSSIMTPPFIGAWARAHV
jgi:ubiquinone/menaquinone biosynthesis C-methylase UbiE